MEIICIATFDGARVASTGRQIPITLARSRSSSAGTALYLSQDRPTIQYALSEIKSGMACLACPTVEHELKFKAPWEVGTL